MCFTFFSFVSLFRFAAYSFGRKLLGFFSLEWNVVERIVAIVMILLRLDYFVLFTSLYDLNAIENGNLPRRKKN